MNHLTEKGSAKAGLTESIHRLRLRRWAKQPRKHFDAAKMDQLAESLRAVGQLQALLVRPLAEPEGEVFFEIIVGERRWRACEAAGLDLVDVRVVTLDDKAALELSVMENVHRDDLDIVEEAEGYAAMVREGWTVAEICQRSGLAPQRISELLRVVLLDDDTLKELREKMITLRVGVALGEIDDLTDRAKALADVVHPKYQKEPLSKEFALRMISNQYLKPQKAAKEWEARRKVLEKKHAGARVLSLREYEEAALDYEGEEDAIPDWELAVHARDAAKALTWGDLADKHHGERFVVPDEDGKPLVVVLAEPLRAAELAAGEVDALDCVFPLRGTRGRHKQSVEHERQEAAAKAAASKQQEMEAHIAETAVLAAMQWMGPKGPALEELDSRAPALVGWLMEGDVDFSESIAALAAEKQVDVEALGDGEALTGACRWAVGQAAEGMRGAWAVILGVLVRDRVAPRPDFAEAMDGLRAVLGSSEPEPARAADEGWTADLLEDTLDALLKTPLASREEFLRQTFEAGTAAEFCRFLEGEDMGEETQLNRHLARRAMLSEHADFAHAWVSDEARELLTAGLTGPPKGRKKALEALFADVGLQLLSELELWLLCDDCAYQSFVLRQQIAKEVDARLRANLSD